MFCHESLLARQLFVEINTKCKKSMSTMKHKANLLKNINVDELVEQHIAYEHTKLVLQLLRAHTYLY